METSENNPASNLLGPGITDQLVADAIQKSGYPLQLMIANQLQGDFFLQEEWAFPDPETQSVRTIDIVATQRLYEHKEPQPRIRPALNFVIECKQSDLPYVFFLSETAPWLRDYPLISGLKSKYVNITTDDAPHSWSLDSLQILGLNEHPFLTRDAVTCMTLSKCVRKGSELLLSGSDAYQGLVFPLIKASSHLRDSRTPPPTAQYFDCELIIPVAVVDAPMVGVNLDKDGSKSKLIPWVRVARHQPLDGENYTDRSTVFGIDVVHKDFLETYINQHALPFAKEFAELALKHHHVLADTKGFVSGMGKNSWNEIEPRLKVSGLATNGKRIKAIAKQVSSLLTKQ